MNHILVVGLIVLEKKCFRIPKISSKFAEKINANKKCYEYDTV